MNPINTTAKVFVIVLAICISSTVSLSLAQSVQGGNVSTTELESLTTKVLHALNNYTNAPDNQSAYLSQLSNLVKARQSAMEALSKEAPEKFLSLSFSKEIRSTFPVDLQSFIEESVEVEGRIDILNIENAAQKFSMIYYLTDAANHRYSLYFVNETPILTPGKRVRVKGMRVSQDSNQIVVLINSLPGASSSNLFILPDVAFNKSTKVVRAATKSSFAANVAGPIENRILFILMNFRDASLSTTCVSDVRRMWSNTLNLSSYYSTTSFNKFTFSSQLDFAGPYTINGNLNDNCTNNNMAWATEAEEIAARNGYNLGQYQHIVHIFPAKVPTTCPGSGWAYTSSNWSAIPVAVGNKCDSMGTPILIHELGHNLGMSHASTVEGGTFVEYGDGSDVMGIPAYFGLTNAPHMDQMNWIPPDNIKTISSNGVYVIYPLHDNINMIQVIKIALPCQPNASVCPSDFYYLSQRQPTGPFDSHILPQYVTGLNIHQFSPVNGGNTNLIKVLSGDGAIFQDPNIGLTIQQLSHTSNSITVSVNLAQWTCAIQGPSLIVNPASQYGIAGQTLNYSGYIDNKNSPACPASVFSLDTLTNNQPIGTTVTPSTITVPGGQKGYFNLQLSSEASITPGMYQVEIKALDNTNQVQTAKAVSYKVIPEMDTIPPSGSVSIQNGESPISSSITYLNLNAQDVESEVTEMQLTNDVNDWTTSSPEPYQTYKAWTLTSGDGIKTVYVKFKDMFDNWSDIYTASVYVDTIGPMGGMVINGGLTFTNSLLVNLSLEASAYTPVTQMQFSNNYSGNINNTIWSPIESYSTTKVNWLLSSGEGVKTVAVRFRDTVGKWSQPFTATITVDTKVPTVTFRMPNPRINVTSDVLLSAIGYDENGIDKIVYYLNNDVLATVNTAPFRFNWVTDAVAIGRYTLTAKVFDKAGNSRVSAAIPIVVLDLERPVVSLTEPLPETKVDRRTVLNFTAVATDNVKISRVQFFVNNVYVCRDLTPPYTCSWKVPAKFGARYIIQAKTYDTRGLAGRSKAVRVISK